MTAVIERDIVIGDIRVHIKSVFNGTVTLDEALKKIITRKMTEMKK